jgi:NAD(P)-dependent dehydrogenase (short-subunit alcohol dehydrogenase family)
VLTLLATKLDKPLLPDQGKAVEEFTQISRDRLEKTFMVNIVGMISLAQKAVEHMKPGGAIINVRPNLAVVLLMSHNFRT